MKEFHSFCVNVIGLTNSDASFSEMAADAIDEFFAASDIESLPYHASNGLVITGSHVCSNDLRPGTRQ